MPRKASGTGTTPRYDPWPGGLTWIAHPQEDMLRASHAVETSDGVWLVDPVDAEGLDDRLADVGPVRGVILLLDRHRRDAASIATRHDVAVYLPDWMDGVANRLDADVERLGTTVNDSDLRVRQVIDNRFWQEAALENGDILIVPETLGTASFYRASGERLGVSPVLRLWPPKAAFDGVDPERVLVGHGPPILESGGSALREALDTARRRAPGAWLNALRSSLR